jgi:hypothetical protein
MASVYLMTSTTATMTPTTTTLATTIGMMYCEYHLTSSQQHVQENGWPQNGYISPGCCFFHCSRRRAADREHVGPLLAVDSTDSTTNSRVSSSPDGSYKRGTSSLLLLLLLLALALAASDGDDDDSAAMVASDMSRVAMRTATQLAVVVPS